MTPGARVAAAIDILDAWLAGTPVEQALTTWARRNRFAGSKDRAAIRDHVFSAVRCKRSFAAKGGALSGRGLMLGAFAEQPTERDTLFDGQGYAPPPASKDELASAEVDLPEDVRLDVPPTVSTALRDSLGGNFGPVMSALQSRAPVFLRVNAAKSTMEEAQTFLAEDGIGAVPHPLANLALEVTDGARRIRQSRAYRTGLVELQDAASQHVVERLGDLNGLKILDYCAGGGGKSLAMAAVGGQVSAYDANFARMRDLPDRATRAGVDIRLLREPPHGRVFDLVLCDAPCSGSGSWRRAPEGKWLLTHKKLDALVATQRAILTSAAQNVRDGGCLAYVTCSLLLEENIEQMKRFMIQSSSWTLVDQVQLTPLDGGDGFFLSVVKRA